MSQLSKSQEWSDPDWPQGMGHRLTLRTPTTSLTTKLPQNSAAKLPGIPTLIKEQTYVMQHFLGAAHSSKCQRVVPAPELAPQQEGNQRKVFPGPSQGCLTHRMYLHTFLPAPRALATNQLGPISCVPLPGPLQLKALPWFLTSIVIQ